MLKKLSWCVFLVFVFNQNVLAQLPDFTEMVKTNGVAVVNISTVQKAKPEPAEALKEQPMPEGMPPEMEELFKHFFNNPEGGNGRWRWRYSVTGVWFYYLQRWLRIN